MHTKQPCLTFLALKLVCHYTLCVRILVWYSLCYGPGSSVGITTDYGLDGPGSNPGGDAIFRSSGPVLGPTQPPVKWLPVLPRG